MPETAEASRRRELQRKAYAPGGGLTEAEADELRALSPVVEVVAPAPASAAAAAPARGRLPSESEAEQSTATAPAVEPPVASALMTEPRPVPDRRPADERPADEHPADERPAPGEQDETAAPRKPRRRWIAPVAATVALLLGFWGGWLAFGREDALSMTPAQQEAWAELEAANYFDAGSVKLVGTKFGVDAWAATREDGTLECLTLTGGEGESQRSCVPASEDRAMYELQSATTIKQGDEFFQVWAMLTQDAQGRPVAIMDKQSQSSQFDWREQYSEKELPIAELLVSHGMDGEMLQIIGYDGDTPIWLHQGEQSCVLVATATAITGQACGVLSTDAPLDLTLQDVTYQLTQADMRGPVLTIIRTPSGTTIDDKAGEVVD